ncbi:adenosine deaminase [Streptomyces sp. NPDC050560]|uniref:adenosine deaminase n=1 Tax=Streptomyces sp. NPDC050560 TaxID=3365630 RepID=UPI00378F9F65
MHSAPRVRRRRPRAPLAAALACAAALTSLVTAPAGAAPRPADGHAPVAAAAAAAAPTAAERRVESRFRSLRELPGGLDAFVRAMPKGGELHSHLSGAASTELLADLAVRDGLCLRTSDMVTVEPPCGAGTRPATDMRTDPALRERVIRAWSMEGFTPGAESGHDHFFATFEKFGEVTWRHTGELLADVLDRAADQHQLYQELMTTPASGGAKALAAKVGWDADMPRMLASLRADGALDDVVADARREADAGVAQFREVARCDTARPRPACSVPYRFIAQVSRGGAPERVFTQIALGMALAERDPRYVGINLVQPEDGEVALRDYHLQMRMVGYLRTRFPRAHVSLHAGELVPGLVKPEDLRFHVADAVRTARTERVGHGVDIAGEDGSAALLRLMARRHVAVETPLTSNDQILQVRGQDHPFPLYRRYGVPVVLATDDQGVARITIGDEYARAARTYGLGYRDLKDLARASLAYAFLPGGDLWRAPGRYETVPQCADSRPGARSPGARCADFLAHSPKAALEWRQESAFGRFETSVLHGGV